MPCIKLLHVFTVVRLFANMMPCALSITFGRFRRIERGSMSLACWYSKE